MVLCVAGLSQPACGGSQAQRALAQAAVFAAIEVAGAAMQAAADEAAARDANKQARRSSVAHRAPTGNWRLVRHAQECESDADDDCDEVETPDSDSERSATNASNVDETDAIDTTEQPSSERAPLTLGPCMVCH